MFKDIKVGDKVLRQAQIVDGFNGRSNFFVPAIVEKTTATRFIVKGKVYTKNNGRVYGGAERCYFPTVIPYSEERDQSEQYIAFGELIKSRGIAVRSMEGLMKKINRTTPVVDLKEIIAFCESMSSRINGGAK